jgi:uncharacterized protein
MMKVRKPTEQEIKQAKTWGVWSKGPSVFDWSYSEKETCYILEGEASVEDSKGNSIHFGAGDWVEFEVGLKCTWNISKTIRKHYNFS